MFVEYKDKRNMFLDKTKSFTVGLVVLPPEGLAFFNFSLKQ